jgi:hypothetical protein
VIRICQERKHENGGLQLALLYDLAVGQLDAIAHAFLVDIESI